MNTIEALHRHLDQNPTDSLCRGVLADALEESEKEEERCLAEGYRAMGVLCLSVHEYGGKSLVWNLGKYPGYEEWEPGSRQWRENLCCRSMIPGDWYALLDSPDSYHWPDPHSLRSYTRKEVEDRLALVFTQLPLERKADLLSGKRESELEVAGV